jgi:hypothetical protein
MSSRALLILVVGMIALSTGVFLQLTHTSNDLSANVNRAFVREETRNIAESGLGIGIRKLTDDATWRTEIPMMDLFEGKATIRFADTLFQDGPAVKVECTGIMMDGTDDAHTEVAVAYVYGDTIPDAIRGLVTTTHDVFVDSTVDLDGREHELDGTTKPGEGTRALWTEGSFACEDSGRVYGHNRDEDIDGDCRSDSTIAEHHRSYAGGFPDTPDKLLSTSGHHFPEGKLESIARSSAGGSQYTTDPATLTLPLKGVTYVDLPDHGCWNGGDISGSGILVVCNDTHNSCLKNCTGSGFTGLIVADGMIGTYCDVNGAVCTLGVNPDSICVGSAHLRFSREAVRAVTANAVKGCRGGGKSKVLAIR